MRRAAEPKVTNALPESEQLVVTAEEYPLRESFRPLLSVLDLIED